MFWKRKPKCPVTSEDKIWIEEKLDWIHENMIDIVNQPTILPTKKFLPVHYDQTPEAAQEVLEILCDYFIINPQWIRLSFFNNNPTSLADRIILESKESQAAGVFLSDGESNEIKLDYEQLKMPESLVATLAHEISHFIIMEEKGYYFEEYENELLTDLTAIGYGFGIFLGNSRFKFRQWSSGDGWGGWSSSVQGYLPQQVIAYAMAEIQRRKGNLAPKWIERLQGSFKKDFIKSLKYIEFMSSET